MRHELMDIGKNIANCPKIPHLARGNPLPPTGYAILGETFDGTFWMNSSNSVNGSWPLGTQCPCNGMGRKAGPLMELQSDSCPLPPPTLPNTYLGDHRKNTEGGFGFFVGSYCSCCLVRCLLYLVKWSRSRKFICPGFHLNAPGAFSLPAG